MQHPKNGKYGARAETSLVYESLSLTLSFCFCMRTFIRIMETGEKKKEEIY